MDVIENISLRFRDCEAGWIHLTIAAGAQEVQVRASHVFDPFPDLIRWMEAMLTDIQACSFVIDEEGDEKELVARRQWDGKLLFTVRDPVPEGEEFFRAVVLRRQLIASIYNTLHEFARSPGCRSHEWEIETLSERLGCLLPGSNERRGIEHLIRLGRDELGKALFDAAPSYIVNFSDASDKGEELRQFAEFALDPDNPQTVEGMVETPDAWRIPEEYDSWSPEKRSEFLLDVLRERVSPYGGCKLGELISPRIERYLQQSEAGDEG